MQRGPKRKKRKTRTPRTQRESPQLKQRVASLDLLRGFAILLMIVDHVAWYFFQLHIEPGSVRFWTRLSMPLFCVLTGYLAAKKLSPGEHVRSRLASTNWRRLAEVAVVMVIVNLFYYPVSDKLEILASLLLAYLLLLLIGIPFHWASLAFLLFPFDVTARLLDYPLSVVVTCVAVGVLLVTRGPKWSLGAAGFIAGGLLLLNGFQGGYHLVSTPSVYVLLFLPVATALTCSALHWRDLQLPLVNWIGRYPLVIYAVQYVVILGIRRLWIES